MSATPKMSYGQQQYLTILSIFLYNILPASQQVDIAHAVKHHISHTNIVMQMYLKI